jgi:hypothetical protein
MTMMTWSVSRRMSNMYMLLDIEEPNRMLEKFTQGFLLERTREQEGLLYKLPKIKVNICSLLEDMMIEVLHSLEI